MTAFYLICHYRLQIVPRVARMARMASPVILIPFPETLTCESLSFTGYSVGRWEIEGSGLGEGQLEKGNDGEGGEVRQDRLHAAHAVDPHQVLLPEAEYGGGQEREDLHGVVCQDQVPQIQKLGGREVAGKTSHDPPYVIILS